MVHGRRKLFDLAQLAKAPLAAEAVQRIDMIFELERSINGLSPEQRFAFRRQHVAPLVTELESWMRVQRGSLSRHAEVAKAMDSHEQFSVKPTQGGIVIASRTRMSESSRSRYAAHAASTHIRSPRAARRTNIPRARGAA